MEIVVDVKVDKLGGNYNTVIQPVAAGGAVVDMVFNHEQTFHDVFFFLKRCFWSKRNWDLH